MQYFRLLSLSDVSKRLPDVTVSGWFSEHWKKYLASFMSGLDSNYSEKLFILPVARHLPYVVTHLFTQGHWKDAEGRWAHPKPLTWYFLHLSEIFLFMLLPPLTCIMDTKSERVGESVCQQETLFTSSTFQSHVRLIIPECWVSYELNHFNFPWNI